MANQGKREGKRTLRRVGWVGAQGPAWPITAVAAAKFLHSTPTLASHFEICDTGSLPRVRPNSDEKGERYSSGRVSSCLRIVGVTVMIDELLNGIAAELTAIGAATDLGSIDQDGERVSAVLTIEDRRVRLSLELAQDSMEDLAG